MGLNRSAFRFSVYIFCNNDKADKLANETDNLNELEKREMSDEPGIQVSVVEKIRAYNRPIVLIAYMLSVIALIWLKADKNVLTIYTASLGPIVGFYIGIKGKNTAQAE